jgi:hypothetical protein
MQLLREFERPSSADWFVSAIVPLRRFENQPRLENSWVRGGLRHQSVLHRRPVKARRFNEVEAALNC